MPVAGETENHQLSPVRSTKREQSTTRHDPNWHHNTKDGSTMNPLPVYWRQGWRGRGYSHNRHSRNPQEYSASQHLTWWYNVQQDIKDLIEKYKERHDIKVILNVLCYVYCTDNGCFSLAVVKRNHIELNDYRRNNNSEKNSIQIEWQPLVGSLQSHEQHLQTVLKTWCRWTQDDMVFGSKSCED